MANTDAPRGFQPFGRVLRKTWYPKIGNDIVYPGDLVLTSSGLVHPGTASSWFRGVAAEYRTSNSTDGVIVYDDPDQLFVAQDDGAGSSATSSSYIGYFYNPLCTAGSATLKISLMELDASTVTTATASIQLVGLYRRAGNAWGSWSDVIVRIAQHQANWYGSTIDE